MFAEAGPWDLMLGLVSAIGVCVTAVLGFLAVTRGSRSTRVGVEQVGEIAKAVGKPNGNGNLAEMNEKLLGMGMELLGWQRDHEQRDDERFTNLERRLEEMRRDGS